MIQIGKHTVINDDNIAVPKHGYRTCEICNIYWSNYYEAKHLAKWVEDYHAQGQEWLAKNKDKLKIEVEGNG